MSEPVNNCLHCGGKARRVDIPETDGLKDAGGSYIECSTCGIATMLFFREKVGMVEGWNRRAAPSVPTIPESAIIERGRWLIPIGYDSCDTEDHARARIPVLVVRADALSVIQTPPKDNANA